MNLFVGNIHQNVNEEALRLLFAEFGSVTSVRIVTEKLTGESRGFGFVEMEDDRNGLEAIDKLMNAPFFGNRLVVSKARPKSW